MRGKDRKKLRELPIQRLMEVEAKAEMGISGHVVRGAGGGGPSGAPLHLAPTHSPVRVLAHRPYRGRGREAGRPGWQGPQAFRLPPS